MPHPLNHRLTDRARKVLQLANQEAQAFNHEYVGTEHILLGLVKEGTGVAAHLLQALGVGLDTIRAAIRRLVQAGPEPITLGRLPLTPRAQRVVELACDECRELQHQYVGTEHLLLGLLRESAGVAAAILLQQGLSLDKVREETIKLVSGPAPQADQNTIAPPLLNLSGRRYVKLDVLNAQREWYPRREPISLGFVLLLWLSLVANVILATLLWQATSASK
jgi:ATP-dependent Clp protease ATP-binding subunit ClpA